MFLLRRILRFILLCYALYSFAIGIGLIVRAENLSPAESQDDYLFNILRESGTAIPRTTRAEERLMIIWHQVCERQPSLCTSSSLPGGAIKHHSPPSLLCGCCCTLFRTESGRGEWAGLPLMTISSSLPLLWKRRCCSAAKEHLVVVTAGDRKAEAVVPEFKEGYVVWHRFGSTVCWSCVGLDRTINVAMGALAWC